MKLSASLVVLLALISLPAARAADLARARLDTTFGSIGVAVKLDLTRDPLSAAKFLRYVHAVLYDGSAFYRVVRASDDKSAARIDIVQGGLTALERALPPVPHESTARTGIHHNDGGSWHGGRAQDLPTEAGSKLGERPWQRAAA